MTFRRTAWLGIAGLVFAGCSSTTQSQGEESAGVIPSMATTESSVSADVILPGTYTADIPAGVAAAPGEWTMEVGPDSIVWIHPEGQRFSPGDVVEMTSAGIVFAADPSCPDQGGEPTEGSYEWSWDGDQLRFTLDSDSCTGRRDTLTRAPWELAP
jgi:hypothetical protein